MPLPHLLRTTAALLGVVALTVACTVHPDDVAGDFADTATPADPAAPAPDPAPAEPAPDAVAAPPAPAPDACGLDEVDGDLALFNWADYIDEAQLDEFAAAYGVNVTLDVFDSNEAMQPIISAGNSGYSLVVPSDYMVDILIASGDLRPLDYGAIPNIMNISAAFVDLPFDPGGVYSVPYQWGTTGLAVDTAVLGPDFPRSWGLVFDPAIADAYAGRITLLNDPRESIGAALKYLGYSLNTTDENELVEARDLLAGAVGRLAAFDTNTADDLLTSGETAIAHGYSGDMFVQFLETDDPSRYVYFVPSEGGARWMDNMVIPADAPAPCTAHTFINWLLTPEQSAALANFTYYLSPNAAAYNLLDEELLEFASDPSVTPLAILEGFQDTGDFEVLYSDAFMSARG